MAGADVASTIALAEAPVAELEAAVTIHPSVTPPPPPPVVFVVEPTATPMAAFALPEESALATATRVPTATPIPSPTPLPATSTPPPTFTPPSLPGTSPNEHYWLYRPIADGGAVWTDKTYPYGSTRGGTLRPHHGVEFNVPSGTPIYSSAAGTVVVAGNDSQTAFGPNTVFYGNLVVIEHESSYRGQPVFTLYGHLSEIGVSVGQKVSARQAIALSGASGIADGPHLHFEVRLGRNDYLSTRNPLLWLYPFTDHGTVAGRIARPNNSPLEELLVTATRLDARSTYKGTTTYGGNTVNGDNGWQENYVLDDLEAGYYLIQTTFGNKKYKQEVWVYELQTTIVDFEINVPNE